MRKEASSLHRKRESSHPEAHFLDQVPVSDLCEENGLQPTVVLSLQKEFFENGEAPFQSKGTPHPTGRGKTEADRVSWRRKSRPRTKSWPN